MDEKIPMIKVSAKPLIGPVSNISSNAEAKIVVKLESKMALNAFL
ncbi:Uncharacterised protein [Chlamydia trachomatis]|nr:Uncharacterised protein [Chlamydia trachomatis]